MHVTISKCMQTVPPVLKIFTGGGATLVTLLREVLKVITSYIKMHVHISK